MVHKNVARLAVTVVLACAGFTGVAEAATVSCGEVITVDTVLDSDVGPCPGDGIVIGADDVTLDLAGHTVRGTGGSSGIVVRGVDGAHVLNGTVTGFARGVDVVFSVGSTIERLVVSNNTEAGISLIASMDVAVRFNLVTGNGIGVRTSSTSNATIESNAVQGNRGAGVFIGGRSINFSATGNRVVRNAIVGNGGDGVVLGLPLVVAEVSGNSIADNAGNGVLVEVFSGDQCCALIQNNVITRNGANGVLIQGNRPLAVPASLNNRVLNNTALSNGIFDLADENLDCDNNVWAGNNYGTRNQPCIN